MLRKYGVLFIIALLLVTAGCRISGRVLQDDGSGNPIGVEGITVTLSGSVPLTTTTNSSGYYEFNNLKIMSNSFLVQPMDDALRFNPANKTVTVRFSNITNVDFSVVKGTLELYRKPVPIKAGVGAGTDYQVKIKIGQSSSSTGYDVHLGGKCNTNFSDIRFTANDGETRLGYWIESISGTTPKQTATVWVKVKADLNSAQSIYVYYGDTEAVSASSGTETFDFYDGFEKSFNISQNGVLTNASTYQTTPTYDGSGQTIHPDVIYLENGFAGYKYWMATTPYPGQNDDYENPSLLASNDGISWITPAGITNPLVAAPACDHNNDADIIYNTNTDELWVYYQETRRSSAGCGTLNKNYIKLIKITSSLDVSSPMTLIEQDLGTSSLYLSPAVVQVDATHFYLWITNVSGQVYLYESSDGLTWDNLQTVNLGDTSWHLNVIYVPAKSEYWMLYMPSSGCQTLNWAVSKDRINWTPYKIKSVIMSSASGWDSVVYRGTAVYDAAADLLKIWYSSDNSAPHTGYVTTDYSNMLDLIVNSSLDGWSVYRTGGSFTISAEQKKRGGMSGKLEQTSTSSKEIIYRPLDSSLSNKVVEWDMYDDMDSTAMKLVRVNGALPVAQQIGIGVYTGNNSGFYSYHNASYGYTTTSVARSNAWHKFGIQVMGDNTTKFYINDASVGSLTQTSASIASISIEGYYAVPSTFYVDDIRARKAATTEPTVGVAGSEEEGSWDIY